MFCQGKESQWLQGHAVVDAANAIARQVASWQFSLISRPTVHVSALWRGELLKHYFGKEIEIANATHTHIQTHTHTHSHTHTHTECSTELEKTGKKNYLKYLHTN